MNEQLTTSERLRQVIEEKHITYTELERLSGVPKSAIQRYASGETKKIPMDHIFRIADALGVTPFEIVGMDHPWEPDKYLAPEWSQWKTSTNTPEDAQQAREELAEDPDRKALFMLSKYGSAKDIRQVNALIDALKATNPDFYDGDDPA